MISVNRVASAWILLVILPSFCLAEILSCGPFGYLETILDIDPTQQFRAFVAHDAFRVECNPACDSNSGMPTHLLVRTLIDGRMNEMAQQLRSFNVRTFHRFRVRDRVASTITAPGEEQRIPVPPPIIQLATEFPVVSGISEKEVFELCLFRGTDEDYERERLPLGNPINKEMYELIQADPDIYADTMVIAIPPNDESHQQTIHAKSFYANNVVLAAHSGYYKALLSGTGRLMVDQGIIRERVHPDTLKHMLHFMYTGVFMSDLLNGPRYQIRELLHLAAKNQIHALLAALRGTLFLSLTMENALLAYEDLERSSSDVVTQKYLDAILSHVDESGGYLDPVIAVPFYQRYSDLLHVSSGSVEISSRLVRFLVDHVTLETLELAFSIVAQLPSHTNSLHLRSLVNFLERNKKFVDPDWMCAFLEGPILSREQKSQVLRLQGYGIRCQSDFTSRRSGNPLEDNT